MIKITKHDVMPLISDYWIDEHYEEYYDENEDIIPGLWDELELIDEKLISYNMENAWVKYDIICKNIVTNKYYSFSYYYYDYNIDYDIDTEMYEVHPKEKVITIYE